jgi:hypothetical protein
MYPFGVRGHLNYEVGVGRLLEVVGGVQFQSVHFQINQNHFKNFDHYQFM